MNKEEIEARLQKLMQIINKTAFNNAKSAEYWKARNEYDRLAQELRRIS